MPLRNRSGLRAATVELQFNFAAAAPPSSHRLAFSHSHANISSTHCGIILCALRRAAVHCRHNPRLKVTARPIAPNDPSKGPSRRRPQPRAARHWPRLLPGTVTAALLGLSGSRGTTSWTTTSVLLLQSPPPQKSSLYAVWLQRSAMVSRSCSRPWPAHGGVRCSRGLSEWS